MRLDRGRGGLDGAVKVFHERAVAEDEPRALRGRYATARREDADQVQGIARADADDRPGSLLAAHAAEIVDRLREAVLLADVTSDEATTANEPARLTPAQRAHDVAPGHVEALTGGELAEDDAVAGEELSGHAVGEVVRGGRGPLHRGPAARRSAAATLRRAHQVSKRLPPVA